jgi:hypothetical protein
MLVIQTQHNGKVFLDSANVEFEKSTAFILFSHLIFKAAEYGLQFFRGVKARHFSSRNKRINVGQEFVFEKLVVLNVEDSLGVLNSCHFQSSLEVAFELLHSVVTVDVGRVEFSV